MATEGQRPDDRTDQDRYGAGLPAGMTSSRRSTSAGWMRTSSRPDGAGSRADWSKPPFVITQPPPNITGALHIGHALTATVEDLMVRRARMQGHPTLWLPGVDHASIAAQVVLDRIIAKDGETRELARPRALPRAHVAVHQRDARASSATSISASARRSTGLALRFTMDEGSARAVRVAFKRLYDDGLAYRGEKLINWCPGDQTSLSRPRGHRDADRPARSGRVRYHLVRDDGTRRSRTRRSPWRRRGRRRSWATRRWRCIRTTRATAALVGRSVLIPFVRARRADHRRRRRAARSSARARSRSRLPTTRTTSRPASATACRSST